MAEPPIVTTYAGPQPWNNTTPLQNPAFTTFFPNQVNGLALWLDGNDVNGDGTVVLRDTPISVWKNKADTLYSCTQTNSSNQPVFIKPGINFSNDNTGAGSGGSIQGFELDYPSYNNNETIYTVVKYNNLLSCDMNILYPAITTGRRFYIDRFNVLTTNINGAVVIASGTLSQNTTTLANSLIYPTQVTHYVNGTSNGSSNYTENFETSISYLGFDNYLGDNCFNGTMYEVLIYTNVLADSDRYKIEAYLYQKWAFNLDPTNPYKVLGYSNYNYPFINSNNFIGTKYIRNSSNILDFTNYPLLRNIPIKFPNTLSYASFPLLKMIVIDWANTNFYTGVGLKISWLPVEGATGYKVFRRNGRQANPYINTLTENSDPIQTRSLLGFPFFNFDSGIINITTYSDTYLDNNNYFVYSYSNTTRSATPLTQIFVNNTTIDLWPVMKEEFIGGSNTDNFTSVNITNAYTNETINVLSNDFNTSIIAPNYPEIHADVPIYTKAFI